jgi:hypothetical protein
MVRAQKSGARALFDSAKKAAPRLLNGWNLDNKAANVKGGGQAQLCPVVRSSDGELGMFRVPKTNGDTARFDAEIDALERLSTYQHPAILELFAAAKSSSPTGPWYVSQRGTPLKEYWSSAKRRHDPAELLTIAVGFVSKLADGLKLCHGLADPVLHRDIKPDNVIVLNGDQPVFIDFGLVFNASTEDRLTYPNQRVANKPFGPDMARGHIEQPTPWLDVWYLGQLLLWMLDVTPIDDKQQHWDRPIHWRHACFDPSLSDDLEVRLRGIAAACANDISGPVTGGDLSAFLGQLFPVEVEVLLTPPSRFASGSGGDCEGGDQQGARCRSDRCGIRDVPTNSRSSLAENH